MATATNNEFFEALAALEKERGLPEDYLIEKIKAAIVIAVKKDYEVEDDNVIVDIDPAAGAFRASLAQDIVGRGGGEALDAAPGLYQDMPEGGGRVEAEAVMVGGSVKIWVGKQVFQQGHGGLAIDGASAVGKDGAGAKRAAWRQGDHITPEGNFPRLQKQAAAGCLQRGAAVKI